MVTNGNVTALADALVREGLVLRTVHARDRRSLWLRLSAAGKRVFDAMTPAHEEWIDGMMSAMSREELARLLGLLGRLKQAARRHERRS
jgi:DNA-binding MarR family transcriptional regulator